MNAIENLLNKASNTTLYALIALFGVVIPVLCLVAMTKVA